MQRQSRVVSASIAGANLGPGYIKEAIKYVLDNAKETVCVDYVCGGCSTKVEFKSVGGVLLRADGDEDWRPVNLLMGNTMYRYGLGNGSCELIDAYVERASDGAITVFRGGMVAASIPTTVLCRFLERHVPDQLVYRHLIKLTIARREKAMDITLFPAKFPSAAPILCDAMFLANYATRLPPRMMLEIPEVSPKVIDWFSRVNDRALPTIGGLSYQELNELLEVFEELGIDHCAQ